MIWDTIRKRGTLIVILVAAINTYLLWITGGILAGSWMSYLLWGISVINGLVALFLIVSLIGEKVSYG